MADEEQQNEAVEDAELPVPAEASEAEADQEEEQIVDSRGNPTVLDEESGKPIEREVIEYKKVECPPCKSGAPAWMATFADMATLLMAFFVLLLGCARAPCGPQQSHAACEPCQSLRWVAVRGRLSERSPRMFMLR